MERIICNKSLQEKMYKSLFKADTVGGIPIYRFIKNGSKLSRRPLINGKFLHFLLTNEVILKDRTLWNVSIHDSKNFSYNIEIRHLKKVENHRLFFAITHLHIFSIVFDYFSNLFLSFKSHFLPFCSWFSTTFWLFLEYGLAFEEWWDIF